MARRPRGASRLYAESAESRGRFVLLFRVLVVTGVLGVVLWGGRELFNPELLPLRTVRIDSPLEQVEQAEIREAVNTHVGAGFLGVDVDAIRNALEELPWVEQAEVRRVWPDKLVIQVTEHRPLARWGSDALLNMRGEEFKPRNAADWERLAQLRGPNGTQRMVAEQYVDLQEMLRPLALMITHLAVDERRAVSLRLDNGLHLGLGRQDAGERLRRFVRIYAKVLHPRINEIDRIDLRYTNGISVHWREGFGPSAV